MADPMPPTCVCGYPLVVCRGDRGTYRMIAGERVPACPGIVELERDRNAEDKKR